MSLDMAMGMQYLHAQTPIIIHRDLKSLNLLVCLRGCAAPYPPPSCARDVPTLGAATHNGNRI